MMTHDIKSLKLCYIISEIQKFNTQEDRPKEKCDHCLGTGFISMFDEVGYDWSLCCTCSTGRLIASAQLVPVWNGLPTQIIKNRVLKQTRMVSNAFKN